MQLSRHMTCVADMSCLVATIRKVSNRSNRNLVRPQPTPCCSFAMVPMDVCVESAGFGLGNCIGW